MFWSSTSCLEFNVYIDYLNTGLVDDDEDERKDHIPTVVVHDELDSGQGDVDAVCLKDAENKVAAGGGLRALRYLRKWNEK